MFGRLSILYHRFSKGHIRSGPPLTPEEWPESWTEIEFKNYPRLPRVQLPEPSSLETSLLEAIKRRVTWRSFDVHKHPTLTELSTLLQYAAGIRNKDNPIRRFYPSGGARYPLEIYISSRGSEELAQGIYHYAVKEHQLEKIGDRIFQERVVESLTYPFSKNAPLVIIVTAVWKRNFLKYQELGYPIVNLEAGHLGENILLLAAALNLSTCPLAGFRLEQLSEALDLNPLIEAPLHAVALGKR